MKKIFVIILIGLLSVNIYCQSKDKKHIQYTYYKGDTIEYLTVYDKYVYYTKDSLTGEDIVDSCGKFIKEPKILKYFVYSIYNDDTLFYKKIGDNRYFLSIDGYGNIEAYNENYRLKTEYNLQYKDTIIKAKFRPYLYTYPYKEMPKEVEINFCKKFAKQQKERTLKFYLVYEGDTLAYEQIGDKKYLHPLRDCEMIKYDLNYGWYLLIDNGKYIYNVSLRYNALFLDFLKICVSKHRFKDITNSYKKYNWKVIGTVYKLDDFIISSGGYRFNKKKLAKGKYRFGDGK